MCGTGVFEYKYTFNRRVICTPQLILFYPPLLTFSVIYVWVTVLVAVPNKHFGAFFDLILFMERYAIITILFLYEI